MLRRERDRVGYLSSGESAGPVGAQESSHSARPGEDSAPDDKARADSLRAALTFEILGHRGYAGLAHTGEFPAVPITLELPAIRDGQPRRDGRLVDSQPPRASKISTRPHTSLYRTAWALIVNTGGTTVLGFVYWAVVAHLYDRQTLGRASALISALLLLSMVTQLNLSSVLPRFLPVAGRFSGRFIAYSYGVSSLTALPVAAGFVFLMPRLSAQWRFLGSSGLLQLLFIVAALVWGIFALEDAALTGLRRAEVIPVENLAYGILKLVLVIGVARLLPAAGIFASWTIPLLVVIPIVNALVFRRFLRPGGQAGAGFRVRQVARYASLDYLASLAAQAYPMVLPLLVLSVLGPAANGSFYIAWTISAGLTLVATNFGMSLMVEAAAAPHKLAELTRGIIARCALVTVLGAAVLALGARPILHIYGAAYAAHAVSLLGLLAIGSIPRAAVIITWSLDRVAGRVGRAAITQAVLALLVLAGSRYLVKDFGINGIGYAWVAANLAISIVRMPTLIATVRHRPAVQAASAGGNYSPLGLLVALSLAETHRKHEGSRHTPAVLDAASRSSYRRSGHGA